MQAASVTIRATKEADATRARIRPDLPQQNQAAAVLARPMIHLVEQVLNGVQFGIMLFLMAAGLTLIFGIMNLINLAHGSLYMVGAYVAAAAFAATGSFLIGLAAALAAAVLVGIAIEIVVFRRLYGRDHLDQVLATFGLILFFNEIVRILFGSTALYMRVPDFLN